MRNNNSKMGLSCQYGAIPTIFLIIGKSFAKHFTIIIWFNIGANHATVSSNKRLIQIFRVLKSLQAISLHL